MENRKGQIQGTMGNVMLVLAVGLLFIVGIYTYTQLGVSMLTATGVSVTNESTFANSTGDYVNTITALNFRNAVKGIAINGSSGQVITNNVTLSGGGLVTNATAIVYQSVNLSYAYTYDADTAGSNASSSLTTQFSNQIPLVGVLIAVVLIGSIIGLLVVSFFFRGRSA